MRAGAIHYEVDGAGVPVVFIHGLGGASNIWFAQREVLSRHFRVIVYDRSGCGLSARRSEGYSIEGWADELAALLDDVEVETSIVVGHSLGSMVAQRFAAKYPERTRALVLVGGEAALSPEGRDILTGRADVIEERGLSAVVDSWLDSVLAPSTRVANPAVAGLLRAMFLANDAHTYVEQAMVLRDADVRPRLVDIACPTLLLVGDQDPVTPLAWQQAIAADIPGSEVRVISGAAHMPMLESVQEFDAALVEFLGGLGVLAQGDHDERAHLSG